MDTCMQSSQMVATEALKHGKLFLTLNTLHFVIVFDGVYSSTPPIIVNFQKVLGFGVLRV